MGANPNRRKIIVLATLILLVLAAVTLVAFFANQSTNLSPSAFPSGTVTPATVERTSTPPSLVNGNIRIDAGSFQSYNFTVPNNIVATVSITFTVNGRGNIRVYLMNSSDFSNWKNQLAGSQNISSIFYSGRANFISDSEVSISIRGTYYIVFDNTFDSSSAKTVDASIIYYWTPT
jgi:hypothetical protein